MNVLGTMVGRGPLSDVSTAYDAGVRPISNLSVGVPDHDTLPVTVSDQSSGREGITGDYVSGNSSAQQVRDERTNFLDQLVGTFTGENQKVLQDLQAAAAKAQYDYSEKLSSTAYQRAVKDMKAAGLNPAVMFASGNGSAASTPQVGIASVATENQLVSGINAAANVGNTISNFLKAIAEMITSVSGVAGSGISKAIGFGR